MCEGVAEHSAVYNFTPCTELIKSVDDEGPFGEGTLSFQSSAPGKGCDNPRDASELNELQTARAIR